jgi:hypothetical protein
MLAVLCCGVVLYSSGTTNAAVFWQGRHLGQEKKAQGRGEQDEQSEGRRKQHAHDYRFESYERDAVLGYYANPSHGLPPGLAKRGGNLPPGLEKQLARNGTLPPGLEKRLEPLPIQLERQLSRLPADCGCRRGIVGTSVMLIRARDHFILDVMHISGR